MFVRAVLLALHAQESSAKCSVFEFNHNLNFLFVTKNSMDPVSQERRFVETGKRCLDCLSHSMQHLLETGNKHSAGLVEQQRLQAQVKNLEHKLETYEKQDTEHLRDFSMQAASIVQVLQEGEEKQQLRDLVAKIKVQLADAKVEAEQAKERYREALSAATQSSLKMSQLRDDLQAAKERAERAERNSVREARKLQSLTQECDELRTHNHELEHRLSLGNEVNETPKPHKQQVSSSSSSSFRVKSVDIPITRKAKTTLAAPVKKSRRAESSHRSLHNVFQFEHEDEDKTEQNSKEDDFEF